MSKGNIFDDVDISDILNDTSIIDGIEKDIFGDNTDSGEEDLDTYNGNNEELDDNKNEDNNISSIDSVEGLSEDHL